MTIAIHHRPLAAFAACFLIGIWTTAASDVAVVAAVALVVVVVAAALMIWKGGRAAVAAAALLAAGFACGALRESASRFVGTGDISRYAARRHFVTVDGTVDSDPGDLPGRVTLMLAVKRAGYGSSARVPADGIVFVTVEDAAMGSAPDTAPGARARSILQYGDAVELHGTLEAPQGARNPGGFSWRAYLARRGAYCTLLVRHPGGVVLSSPASPESARRGIGALRRWMSHQIRLHLSPVRAALLAGILIGRRADLPPDLTADFVHTGTVHIVASAGLHVGILALFVWFVLIRLTVPRKAGAIVLALLLACYVELCGGRPSVTRAVLMAVAYLGAIVFEREPDIPTAIAAAALAILAAFPSGLFEPGFELSFVTVCVLAAGMPVWDALVRPRIEELKAPVLVKSMILRVVTLAGLTVFAQLGSMAVVAAAYDEVSLSGVAANLLVVPLLFLIIPLGVCALLLSAVVPPAGAALFRCEAPLLDAVVTTVRHFAHGATGFTATSPPEAWQVVLYYAVLFRALWAARVRLARDTSVASSIDNEAV
ncbi:MAG: ComEC/Rec2 family competence protein [Capsulimonadaceae bacterium]